MIIQTYTESERKELKLQVFVFFSNSSNNQTWNAPFNSAYIWQVNYRARQTPQDWKLHRHVHTCRHFRWSTGQCSASSHGIRTTSKAGQLYSYCILNYQDSGFYRTLVFLRDLLVLFSKRMKRIQSITLCTYGLKHFKGYNKVQMYII